MDMMKEANRCLLCKNAKCRQYCPIDTPVPEIMELYKEGKLDEAGEILFQNNPLSAVCSIICAHENQCTGHCIRGIKGEPIEFYRIEEFISNRYFKNLQLKPEKKLEDRVAIVGSGPGGITIALNLAIKGYKVTLFESRHKIGGVLRYGIPEFRLPKDFLDQMQEKLIQLGVKIRVNTLIGPVLTIDRLFEDGYKAIFLGTGVWNPKTLGIKGESFGNVNYAIDYLKSPKSYYLGNKVAVIGAGNVAMDAARTAIRDSKVQDVTVFYRKGFEDMSATKSEIEDAKGDGIRFDLYKSPLEILDEGLRFIKTEKVTDDQGNTKLVTLEGTEDIFTCDSIIIAASQSPKSNIVRYNEGFETTKQGLLVTNEIGNTTREGVFAAGDVVTGARTAVEAVSNAKMVANAIDEYCKSLKKEI